MAVLEKEIKKKLIDVWRKQEKREWVQTHICVWVEVLKSSSSIGMGKREQGRKRRGVGVGAEV